MAQPQFNAPSLQELLLTARTGADQGAGAIRGFRESMGGAMELDRKIRAQQIKAELEKRAMDLKEKTLTEETRIAGERISATKDQTSATREATEQRRQEAIADRKARQKELAAQKEADRKAKITIEREKIGERTRRALEGELTDIQRAKDALIKRAPQAGEDKTFFQKLPLTKDFNAERTLFQNLDKRERQLIDQIRKLDIGRPLDFDINDLTTPQQVKAAYHSGKISKDEARAKILDLQRK